MASVTRTTDTPNAPAWHRLRSPGDIVGGDGVLRRSASVLPLPATYGSRARVGTSRCRRAPRPEHRGDVANGGEVRRSRRGATTCARTLPADRVFDVAPTTTSHRR